MQTVRQIAEEIIAREGGYVNDPDDPGRATKFGVTVHTMRRLGLDLDGGGAVGPRDVKRLTQSQAIDIFITHYFERPRIGEVPEALRASLFDMYVNAGANAVKILQRLLREMGYQVQVDGRIGPQTLGALRDAAVPDPLVLRDAYAVARRNHYFHLADHRPASRKYARTRGGRKGGWIKRAETFMSDEFHLSRAEFERRIAAWG